MRHRELQVVKRSLGCFGEEGLEFSIVDSGTFSFAETSCSLFLADQIATIKNDRQLQFVFEKLQGLNGVADPFIGLVSEEDSEFDLTDPRRFSFTDGSTDNLDFIHTSNGEEPWAENEPSNDASNTVAVIRVSDGLFAAADPNIERTFLCVETCEETSETVSPTPSQITAAPNDNEAVNGSPITQSPSTSENNRDIGNGLLNEAMLMAMMC